jgi:lysophospholipase L1-like esterase
MRTPMLWVATALVAACAPAPVQPPASPVPTGPSYVAMGDSAAAAPLVPDQGTPTGCFKSTNNYPSVLARRLDVGSFTDVTCSGARTEDLRSRSQPTRSGPVPPQLDAVRPDTGLVTITIGGNDVDLSSHAAGCRRASLDAAPCSTGFVVGGVDTVSQAIEEKAADWAALVDAVREKAPGARIVLVGYGSYIRQQGCFPAEPINPVDAAYFAAKLDELDNRQQQVAADEGAEFFDPRPLSAGHDLCAAPADRYFEGFAPANPAAPLHPNAMGAKAFGVALADYVASGTPGT